jgi:hypothetical protein
LERRGAFDEDEIFAELGGGGLAECGECVLWVEGIVWGVRRVRSEMEGIWM